MSPWLYDLICYLRSFLLGVSPFFTWREQEYKVSNLVKVIYFLWKEYMKTLKLIRDLKDLFNATEDSKSCNIGMNSILCLTCLLYLVNATGDKTSRKVSSDCYYFSKFDSFFFQINIGGISQNISCLQSCWCNGTDTGYSSLNCQACCCQNRILYKKEVIPGRIKRFIYTE